MNPIKNRRALLVATIALVASIGVAVQGKNWLSFTTRDGGMTIQTPQGWGAGDPDAKGKEEIWKQIRENNPKLAEMMSENQNNEKYVLYLYDFNDDATDGLDNLNISLTKDSGLDASMYDMLGKEILKQMPFTNKGQYKIVNLPSGKALSYWGDMTIDLGGGQQYKGQLLGYVVCKANRMYILTMMTTDPGMKTKRTTFENIAKSISFK